ncbi:MAG TPA: VIT1/CCC1 transporter family protein [Chloroflexota bacterium]|nr:VIT1/CCC1 transporter family protein [Chloroflexota bacterium]
MTHTTVGLFSDRAAIEQARRALADAGLTRTAAYTKDAGEQNPHPRRMLLVEAEGRELEARRILLRAGAQSLEDRPSAGHAALLPPADSPAAAECPPEEQHPHGGDWLRDIVFGLNDGLVTTLVFIVAASAVAQTHAALLLVALSEVIAGGVSMFLGGYLAARTEHDLLAHRIATERQEIEQEPEEERAELRDIYRRKGMTGLLLEHVVAHQTAEHDRWLQALIHDELGVVKENENSPAWQGAQIGISFVLGGLIPTIPVFLAFSSPWLQLAAYALTALTALGLGALKTRYSLKGPLRNALEFLVAVTAGTVAGVVIGAALHAA